MSALELPEGLTGRTATPAVEDAEAVLKLVQLAEEHYDGEIEVEMSDVEMDFRRVGFVLARDCVLVFDGDEAVGWANVHRDRAEVDVRPSHHGRGIGSALLRWTESHARGFGAWSVRQTVTDNNRDARRLFLANGYAASGTAWILQISFDEPPPRQPIPKGITIRPYDPRVDEEAAYRLIEDAFGEWEGRPPTTIEEWRASITEHTAFSPALSRVAFDGDELVGATMSFNYASDVEGWVQQVATKASHRFLGIARALLYETFRAFYDRGKARCGLSTESRTGALALYEHVGMRVRRSYTRYTKRLA
jgi:GNAT superfamily N-acetyltransferase